MHCEIFANSQIHVISQQKINLPVKYVNRLGTVYFLISILYMSLLLHFSQFFSVKGISIRGIKLCEDFYSQVFDFMIFFYNSKKHAIKYQ